MSCKCDPPFQTDITITVISDIPMSEQILSQVMDELLRSISLRTHGPVLKYACNSHQTELLH